MRITARACVWVVVLVVSVASPAGQASPLATPDPVEEAWHAVQAAAWGQAVEQWTGAHREAACEPFHGQGAPSGAGEEWTYHCTQHAGDTAIAWWFYAFDSAGAPVSRLEQLRIEAHAPSADILQAAHRQLALRLTQTYGPGAPAQEVWEFGSSYWRDVFR